MPKFRCSMSEFVSYKVTEVEAETLEAATSLMLEMVDDGKVEVGGRDIVTLFAEEIK